MAITSANQLELLQTAEAVAREKMIDPALVIEAMEESLARAAKSRYGAEMDIRVSIDRKTGKATFTRVRTVIDPEEEEVFNLKLFEKQEVIEANEIRFKTFMADDAKLGVVAFGTSGRVAQSAIREAREKGIKVGLFRPITLWPYPMKELHELSKKVKKVLTVDMSAGQMLEDVNIAVNGAADVDFLGRLGGAVPESAEIIKIVKSYG